MEMTFQNAKMSKKGDKIVTVSSETSIGRKTSDFILIRGQWWNYPEMTPAEPVEVTQLDLIKVQTLDHYEFPKYSPSPGIDLVDKEPEIWHMPDSSTPLKGKPVLFVSCTVDNDSDRPIDFSVNCARPVRTVYKGATTTPYIERVWNNKRGLSEVYNEFVNEKYRDYIVVFVHDDVYLDDNFVISKLHKAHKTYDIVGIAGCKNPVVQEPPMWHLMSKELRGFCAHEFPHGGTSMSVYGPSDDEVHLIDGVFMSVDVNACLDAGVTFDEEFDFHFYDLAFCMRAVEKGLKIGVVPIFIRHLGLGQPDARWNDLKFKFMAKYQ